jgi:hypothetical protein
MLDPKVRILAFLAVGASLTCSESSRNNEGSGGAAVGPGGTGGGGANGAGTTAPLARGVAGRRHVLDGAGVGPAATTESR